MAALKPVHLVVVLAVVLAACGLGEDPLSGRRSCWPLEEGEDFGQTRELSDVDIVLFSRPGKYSPDQVAEVLGPLGVSDDAEHVQRTVGPCGQQDVFLAIDAGEACVTVVGLDWWDRGCVAVGAEPEIELDLGDIDGFATAVVTLGVPSHVRAESDGFLLGAFDMGGVALLTSPEPLGPIAAVGIDGSVLDG